MKIDYCKLQKDSKAILLVDRQKHVDFPVQIFMERITGAKLAAGLAIQAFWAVMMWLLAITLWRRGIRRYQAAGN